MAIPWHRIFGMALTQYFAGTDWKVDVEVDLSVQQQRLDVVVLRCDGQAAPVRWPDGFGAPAEYNLLTFKALKDPLNAYAIKELAAHGVNYRKLRSPGTDDLLPESHFRLLAASMHFPQQLHSQVPLQPRGPGAYDLVWVRTRSASWCCGKCPRPSRTSFGTCSAATWSESRQRSDGCNPG